MSRLIFRGAVAILAGLLPWLLRRHLYQAALGWKLHPTSRIGRSLILADHVILEAGARIGNSNVISPIGLLHLGLHASIGKGNRVVGGQHATVYANELDRRSALIIEEHAAITRMHIIDCSNTVVIGSFSIVAGYRTQILTHSPDFKLARQTSRPVRIGSHCFIGTGCIVLFGAELPDCSILSAGSVLTNKQTEPYQVYAGNPAVPIKALDRESGYFHRSVAYLGN